MKLILIAATCISTLVSYARQNQGLSNYTGKYEANGMIVQVVLFKNELSLIVPGAPVQVLKYLGNNRFQTSSFSDEIFVFAGKQGQIESMISERGGQSLTLKKISNKPDDFAGFHQGINFPDAPAEVLATAFGKDDFRMVSPQAVGVDSAMLMKGITHEFTHVVHLNIDYSPNNPRWLWEGVAMYESGWFFDPAEIEEIKNRNFPSLSTLGNGMEYMLGYVIIEAIKETWGFDTVIGLIKNRGNVRAVLKMQPNEFEKTIFDYIYGKYIEKNKK